MAGDEKINSAQSNLLKKVPLKEAEEEVIKNISNMLNSVYEISAITELRKKLDQSPELFTSAAVFEHVLLMLQIYRFRPKGRKIIFNLFEMLIFGNQMDS